MSIIKMNSDKSLTVTVISENYTIENLAEELSFLIPYKYNNIDLSSCTVLLSLIGVNDTEYSTPLVDIIALENIEQYNNNYFSCSIPITKKYTFQPLTYKLWLTFINADSELVLKTGSSLIKITPSEVIEEYFPDSTLSLIDQYCSDLTYINLQNVETIQNEVFKGCINLTSLKIPNTVKRIGSCVFWTCKLKSITYPENPEFTIVNQFGYGNNNTLQTVSIPSNVEIINSSAFNGCVELKTITINKPVDSISGAPWGAVNATVIWTSAEDSKEM